MKILLRKTGSLSNEVSKHLKDSPFDSQFQKFEHNIKKAKSFGIVFRMTAILFLVILFFIPYISLLPSYFLIFLDKEGAIIQIEKRIANIVTLISVSSVVLTFIINIADKQRFGKDAFNLILEEIYFFPILYFVLSSLGFLTIISAYQDTVPENTFIGLSGSSNYIFIGTLITIGFLFRNVALLLNTNFLFTKRLERLNLFAKIETHKDAYKYISKALFIKNVSPLIEKNRFQAPNNTITNFYIDSDKDVVDVHIKKLEKIIKHITSKYESIYIVISSILLKEKLYTPVMTTDEALSKKEILQVKKCFKQKKSTLINEVYRNEIDALKIMLWNLLDSNNGDVKKAKKIFAFFDSLLEIFSRQIIRYKEVIPNETSWWLVPKTVLNTLSETIDRLSLDKTNTNEFKEEITYFILKAQSSIIYNGISQQKYFLYHDFILWRQYLIINLFRFGEKIPNYIFEPVIKSYGGIFNIINSQFLQLEDLNDKKRLLLNTIPKIFRSLDNLARKSYRNRNFKQAYLCIRQIQACELDGDTKEEIFDLGKKIKSFEINAIENKEKLVKLRYEYYTKKYPFYFQNSILILFASTLFEDFQYGNLKKEELTEFLKRLDWNYSNKSIEILLKDWLWLKNNWNDIERERTDFQGRNDEKWFITVQLLKNNIFNNNALENQIENEDLIYHHAGHLKNTIQYIDNKKMNWLSLLEMESEEIFESQKLKLLELIAIVEIRYKQRVKNEISIAKLSNDLISRYKKNIHKGYIHSFEMGRFLSLFEYKNLITVVSNQSNISKPIILEEFEEKKKIIDGYFEESKFMPDLFGYIEGNDIGRKLARKETEVFINEIFTKGKSRDIQYFSELEIDKYIIELNQKGYTPDVIITNVNHSIIFKEYQEKLGNTEFSGWQYSDITYRYLHLKDTTPFLIICQFDKAFEKLQVENDSLTGKIISTEITELTIEEFKKIYADKIKTVLDNLEPRFSKNEINNDESNYEEKLNNSLILLGNWIEETAKFHINRNSIYQEEIQKLYDLHKSEKSVKIKTQIFSQFLIKDEKAIILGIKSNV